MLREAGINFFIRTKDIPENYPSSLPLTEVPVYLAKLKADAFRNEIHEETVLTADTIVLLEGKVLGKPKDLSDAKQMLKELSGKCHHVITGVYIFNKTQETSFAETTKVYFKILSEADINHYINNWKPLDKAGSYGIQEWIGLIGIEKIEGSYFNVMGLPIHRVVEKLKEFDLAPDYNSVS